MEQRERNAELKALSLISEFIKKFRSIDFTLHPFGIPGEAAGKGSNCAWAARRLSERYPLQIRQSVIVTSIDGMFARPSLSSRHQVTGRAKYWAPLLLLDGSLTSRLTMCSRQPPVLELLCPYHLHAPKLPRDRPNDPLRGPYHIRSQCRQGPCYRPCR